MERFRKATSLSYVSLFITLGVVGWGCGDSEGPSKEPKAAEIFSFIADPEEISGPTTVTLSWLTEHAESIFLVENGELLPAGELSLRSGSIEVEVDETTEFELVAVGKVGEATKRSRVVELIDTTPPPSIGTFVGPEVVGVDERGLAQVRLAWTGVARASELILESDRFSPRRLDASEGSDGELELIVEESSVFTLVAKSQRGEARKSVSVRVVPLPVIESLAVSRSWVGAGEDVLLSWSTEGASEVELWIDGVQVEEFESEEVGSFSLNPMISSELELRAYNEVGAMVAQRVSLRVGAPQIISFAAEHTSLWLGESQGLEWASEGGSSFQVFAEGFSEPVCEGHDPAAIDLSTCSWQPPAAGDHLLTLEVSNASGVDSASWAFSAGIGPILESFTMTPQVLNRGEEILINWTVLPDPAGEEPTLSLVDDQGNTYPLPKGQRFARLPLDRASGDLQFTLRAETSNPLSTAAEARTRVLVHDLPAVTLKVTPTHFDEEADEAVLDWTSSSAAELVLYQEVGDELVELLAIPEAERAAGSHSFLPLKDEAYRLVATNALGESATARAALTIVPPEVLHFEADRSEIVAGEEMELSWDTRMARELSLSIFRGSYVREESLEAFVDVEKEGGAALPLTAACGEPVATSGCAKLDFPEGFSFPFGGSDRSFAIVHNNGFISFDPVAAGASSTYSKANVRLPSEEASFVHLAPFWDGLGWDETRYPSGNISFLHRKSDAGQELIIQWKDVGFANSVFRTASLNFQVVLKGDGDFEYRYGAMEAGPAPAHFAQGSSATVGYQLPDRSEADTRNFDTIVQVRGALRERTFSYRQTPQLAKTGSYLWRPYATQGTVSANLRARWGELSDSKTVTVTVHEKPELLVEADAFAMVGKDAEVRWDTEFTSAVVVLDEEGKERCKAGSEADVASGSCSIAEEREGIYTYRIRAIGALDFTVEKSVQIKIYEPFGIASFEADRTLLEHGQPVTLSWVTENAPKIALLRNGREILPKGVPSGPGTTTVDDLSEDTTFILQVTNSIGMVVEASVFVEMWKVDFQLEPSTLKARPGETVTVQVKAEGLGGTPSPMVIGSLPLMEVASGAEFKTVAGPGVEPLQMTNTTTGLADVEFPEGFTFPYFGEHYSNLRVFVEGFISFFPTASSTSSNRRFPDSSSATYWNVHLAPFWANFTLHSKAKIYAVQTDEDTFVIEWSGTSLATGSTNNTNEYDLNFQVVLYRSGAFEYRYGKMTPSPNGSTSCRPNDCSHEAMASTGTIGYQMPGGSMGFTLHHGGTSSNEGNPTIPLEGRTFRYEHLMGSGVVEIQPTQTDTYTFCTTTGEHMICKSIEIEAEFGLDSLEILADIVDFGDTTSLVWETHGGTKLRVLDGEMEPLLTLEGPADYARIDSGSFEVMPSQNTTYTLELSALGNTATATASVEVIRVRVTASLNPESSFPGEPIELEWKVKNADPELVPVVIKPLEEIQGRPFSDLDISGDPDVITLYGGGVTSGSKELPFDPDFTFDFMGQKKTFAVVSVSGYVSFDPSTSSSSSNSELPNSTTSPKRVQLAPFWDSIYTRASGRVIAKRIDLDTYVIQWSKMSYSSGSSNTAEHDINFMVVLRRDGEFEYRYGLMKGLAGGATSTSCQPNPSNCDNEANGSSATIGYQNEDGTAGFTLHHATTTNQLRFVPLGLGGRTWRFTKSASDGKLEIAPWESTVYRVCAYDPASGDVFCAEPVLAEVKWGIAAFDATPWAPVRGKDVTLSWEVVGLDELVLTANGVEIESYTGSAIPPERSLTHRPTENTTYVLEGTSLGRTVRVQRDVEIRAFSLELSPSSTRIFPGDEVIVSWRAEQHEPGDLHLVTPMGEIAAGPGQPGAFADIKDKPGVQELKMSNNTSGYADVEIPFDFPYFGEAHRKVRVFVPGVVGLQTTSTTATGTNAALPSSTLYKFHLAPFWDSLAIIDATTNRILTWSNPEDKSFVIQWTNFNRSGATAASQYDMNFQVVLWEDGAFEYRYGKLAPPPTRNSSCYSDDCRAEANGSSATIGYQTTDGGFVQQFHFGGNSAAAAVEIQGGLENRTLRFQPGATGSVKAVVSSSDEMTFCGYVGNFVDCQTIHLRTVADPGDLMITEVMADPAGGANGQWFELRNLTKEPIDLDGFVIAGKGGEHKIPRSLSVEPGKFVTLAASAGVGFEPDFTYTGLSLNPREDELALRAGTATIGSLSWQPSWNLPAGRSLELDPSFQVVGSVSNDEAARWCQGAPGGTPKALGRGCRSEFYDVDPTSQLAFIDISKTGKRVLDLEVANSIVRLEFPGLTMPFFDGTVSNKLWVGQNGWISFASADPGGSSTSSPTATALPRSGTAAPLGPIIAPFWGTLRCDNAVFECDFRHELRMDGGQSVLIFQWTGFRWSTSVGSLTVQAQLWESGDVVVAFGDVYSADAPDSTGWNNYRGNTAWIGLEGPDTTNYVTGHHRSVLDMDRRTFHFIRK